MTGSGNGKKKDQDIKIGKKYSLRSKVLKEERPYWVYLPNSYDDSNKEHAIPFSISWMAMLIFNRPAVWCNS